MLAIRWLTLIVPRCKDSALRHGNTPRILLGLSVASLLCSVTAAAAEYHLDVGDVIEISVARAPELQRRVAVKLDGSISYPLLGTIAVAGLTPSQAQAKVQAGLATKIFQPRSLNGRDSDVVIDPNEVTATIVEYRPIYVNGDVAKPGEYPYRPLMTVRQAVALSGGYDTMRFRTSNPILDWAELKSDYESYWIEFAKEQAHVWRLKAELANKSNPDQRALDDLPLAQSTISEINRVEAEHLSIRQVDHARQKTYLRQAIKQGDEQIAVLSEQQQKEEQGLQSDVEELKKSVDLYGKGTLTSPRVTDARRAVLLSSTRKLQTAAQLMQFKRQQDELGRQLEHLDDQRRIDLLSELQDAEVKLGEIRAKLQGIGDRLQYTALLKSRLERGNGYKLEIFIVRKIEKSRERVVANDDLELQPGDVVEVALQTVSVEVPAQ
jgi:polysaccharide export outer membrane protein